MFFLNLDQRLTVWVYEFSGHFPALDFFGRFISEYLIFFMTAAVVFWAAHPLREWRLHIRKSPHEAIFFWLKRITIHGFPQLFSVGLAVIASQAWKSFISYFFYFRTRPEWAHLFDTHPYDASFPSNHAAGAFALAAIVFSWERRLTRFSGILLGCAALVSFGRVFEGLHYVSDVTAGAVVGVFSAWVIVRGIEMLQGKYKKSN